MASSKEKWFRVIDPLSPLYGCDVRGYDASLGPFDIPKGTYLNVSGMRRIDVFVGDRPFQLIAPKQENLGLLVLFQQLRPSPLQDDVVELAVDSPHGDFLDEVEIDRPDGCTLHVVAFSDSYQMSLCQPQGRDGSDMRVVASRTIDCSPETMRGIQDVFLRGDPVDEMKQMIDSLVPQEYGDGEA